MSYDERNTWWFILAMNVLFLISFTIFAYYMRQIANAV